jgi:hypothetical protein
MADISDNVMPKLEASGKGLPWLEQLVGRYVVMPLTMSAMSNQSAYDRFSKVAQSLISTLQGVDVDVANRRVLVERITGLEDSSRYWSPVMIVDHLTITSTGILGIVQALCQGEMPERVVRIEDVKPSEQPLNINEVLERYQMMMDSYHHALPELLECIPSSTGTHSHPWFGQFTAHHWWCMNAIHHEVHLKQMQLILKR